MQWNLFTTTGLSAFDVHEQTGVFAAYVIAFNSRLFSYSSHESYLRTSAITPMNWRTQRTLVQPIARSEPVTNIPTTISMSPTRDLSSSYTQRTSSLAFHPREMVYASAFLDGSGMCLSPCLPLLALMVYPHVTYQYESWVASSPKLRK